MAVARARKHGFRFFVLGAQENVLDDLLETLARRPETHLRHDRTPYDVGTEYGVVRVLAQPLVDVRLLLRREEKGNVTVPSLERDLLDRLVNYLVARRDAVVKDQQYPRVYVDVSGYFDHARVVRLH